MKVVAGSNVVFSAQSTIATTPHTSTHLSIEHGEEAVRLQEHGKVYVTDTCCNSRCPGSTEADLGRGNNLIVHNPTGKISARVVSWSYVRSVLASQETNCRYERFEYNMTMCQNVLHWWAQP